MGKYKDHFWQYVRAICILAVLLIHCSTPTAVSSKGESIYYLFVRNLINFPVAIFFFLSGYFVKTNETKLFGGVL